MCGIVAALTESGNVVPDVISGLKTLEYRGYDSAGVSVMTEEGLQVRRKMGKIANLEAELLANELPHSVQAIARIASFHADNLTHRNNADDGIGDVYLFRLK
mgnify:CR=1 FL=1